MKTKLGIIGIVEKQLAQDRRGTLARLRALGYRGIELGLITQEEQIAGWAADLKQTGLEWVTCHLGQEALRGPALDDTIRSLRSSGARYATLSWAVADSVEQIREDAKLYNEAGARLREAGITLCYHNHEHEFSTRFGGRTAFDILMDLTKPETLSINLDVAWATYGGMDPVAVLQRYAGRVAVLHIKDLYHLGPRECFTAPGTGVVNLHDSLRAAAEVGCEWFIVEQDMPRRLQGLDLATAAVLNLRELGLEVD
jgi:sugar phosphate isomerase/epimerase